MIVFSCDVTAAMLVSPINPPGTLFICKRFLLFRLKTILFDHVSENTLLYNTNFGEILAHDVHEVKICATCRLSMNYTSFLSLQNLSSTERTKSLRGVVRFEC